MSAARVLVVLPDFPFPETTGFHLRLTGDLEILRRAGVAAHVAYFSTENRAHDPLDPRFRSLSASVTHLGARRPQDNFSNLEKAKHKTDFLVRGLLGIRGHKYPFSMRYDSVGGADRIASVALEHRCEFVLIPSFFIHYSAELKRAGLTVIADSHDVLTDLTRRLMQSESGIRRLGLLANYVASRTQERLYLPDCREIWATTASEARVLKAIAPDSNIFAIPNTIDETAIRQSPFPNINSIGFIGNFTMPANLDAAKVLACEVMPLVLRVVPDATLLLAGAGMPDDVREKLSASPGVRVLGPIQNSSSLFDACDLIALPIRLRGGVPLKLVEAFARSRPVVATPELIEGLDLVNGKHLLVSNSAGEFAGSVIQLLRDSAEKKRLGQAARRVFLERWSREAATRIFIDRSVLVNPAGVI